MGCSIPNINLNYKVKYDITSSTPSVVITNQTTGANLANLIYYFELYTPSGVLYHQGSFLTPDASGVWTTINISEQIPSSNGKIEFSNVPYIVKCFVKDNLGNLCELEKKDVICNPSGNKGNNNFGGILLDIQQKCSEGRLQITDVSNYVYNNTIGSLISNETRLIYPALENGSSPADAVVNNQNAFTLPIPINGKGHILYRNSILKYVLISGNEVLIKYKYKNDSLEINCNLSLCGILCGITKYRESLLDDNGKCSVENQTKINDLHFKIAQLTLALNYPACGFDVTAIYNEVKAELTKNDCYCDCNDNQGNNNVTALSCSNIDIACVWDNISILLNADNVEKAKFCSLVTDCISAANSSVCSQVLMSGVIFTPTKFTVNFQLQSSQNSSSLKVYYKLHSASTWTLAQTLASSSTTYDILGTFAPGDLYDVKVVNNCSGGANIDSIIVSGIVPQAFDKCFITDLMYSGLANGVYAMEVDSTQSVQCDKIKPKLIDDTFVQSKMPCATPVNVKIASNKIISWDGYTGDFEVSYKLKSTGTWTVFSTNTYTGTNHTEDLTTVITSAIDLYDFRIRRKCSNTSYSLPIYCDYLSVTTSSGSSCLSAADFISFNESTGDLRWFGATAGATYIVKAIIQAYPSGLSPVTTTISGNTLVIDFSNLLPFVAAEDEITFYVQRDCGGGVLSDKASHYYIMSKALVQTPIFPYGFQYNNIENDTIYINNGGGSANPHPLILHAEYEMRVTRSGSFTNKIASTGTIVIGDGNDESPVKSSFPLKTGDNVQFRFKTYGNFNGNNVVSTSGWGSWGGTVISLLSNLGVWSTITPLLINGVTAGASNAYYKISKDKESFYSRGYLNIPFVLSGNSTATINLDIVDITPIASLLSSDLSLSQFDDTSYFEETANFIFSIRVTRTNNVFNLVGNITTKTSTSMTSFTLPITNLLNIH